MNGIELYEDRCGHAREFFTRTPAFEELKKFDKKSLHAFWIAYSARGVGMTKPVDGWVRRAGEGCIKHGYEKLGKALLIHADHEKDHHHMMIEDCRRLVALWNNTYPEKIQIRDSDNSSHFSVRPYIDLHEEIISSKTPFRQLAVEYEVELLSISAGPVLLSRTQEILGQEFLENLSFLTDHSVIDVGHTKFNEEQMKRFLESHPDTVKDMYSAGRDALQAYGLFITGCFWEAQDLEKGLSTSVHLPES